MPTRTLTFLLALILCTTSALAQSGNPMDQHPWMNTTLTPDERADLLFKLMTMDEKITLLHGTGMEGLSPMSPLAVDSNGCAGYVPGIPRLGIPAIQMCDAAYGVRMSGKNAEGRRFRRIFPARN